MNILKENKTILSNKELRDTAKIVARFINSSTEKSDLITILEEILNNKMDKIEFYEFLLSNNFIKEDEKKHITGTVKLNALAAASLSKRKKINDAWLECAKTLIKTVSLANVEDWNIDNIQEIYLFGSILDINKTDYGDVDMAINLQRIDKDYNLLKEHQSEWVYNNMIPVNTKLIKEGFFYSNFQLIKDITNVSKFSSIHLIEDVERMVKDGCVVTSLKIWENKVVKNKNISSLNEKSKDWIKNNKSTYQKILLNLNNALNKLGVANISDKIFEESCDKYMYNLLLKEGATELKKYVDDMPNDSNIVFKKILRSGDIGAQVLGSLWELAETEEHKEFLISYYYIANDMNNDKFIENFDKGSESVDKTKKVEKTNKRLN